MAKHWTQGFAEAVADIRHKLVEEGFWGRVVTPRSQTITFDSQAKRPPSEKLGWTRPKEGADKSPQAEHERDVAAKEPKGPDRGIDL